MNIEARKDEIRRRLRISKYPRRAQAVFNDENDHNPLVLEECAHCHGTGHVDIYEQGEDFEQYVLEECPVCSGAGITGEVVPYFDNVAPAMDVKARDDGWAKCPRCGWRFSLSDAAVWTGLRHKRCGQKLNVGPIGEGI